MNLRRLFSIGLAGWLTLTAPMAAFADAAALGANMGSRLGSAMRATLNDQTALEQDAKDRLGITDFSSSGDPGDVSSITLKRSQERALACKVGREYGLASARVLIESCEADDKGVITELSVSVCDGTAWGGRCYGEAGTGFSEPLSVALGEDTATSFNGAPLNANYDVSAWCVEPEDDADAPDCRIRVVSGLEGTFGDANERKRADEAVQQAADHILHDLADTRNSDEFARLEGEGQKYADHFPSQVEGLYAEGIIRSLDGNSVEMGLPEDCEEGSQRETCTVDIPTTEIACEAETKACEVEREVVRKTCQGAGGDFELTFRFSYRDKGGYDNFQYKITNWGSLTSKQQSDATAWLRSNIRRGSCESRWYSQSGGTLILFDERNWNCPYNFARLFDSLHDPNGANGNPHTWLTLFHYHALPPQTLVVPGDYDYSPCASFENRKPGNLETAMVSTGPVTLAAAGDEEYGECYRTAQDDDRGVRTYTCYGNPSNSCDTEALEEEGFAYQGTSNFVYPSDDFPGLGHSGDMLPIRWTETWAGQELVCEDDPGFGCGEVYDVETHYSESGGYLGKTGKKLCYSAPTPSCGQDDGSLYDRLCLDAEYGLCTREQQTWIYGSSAACMPLPGVEKASVPFNEGAFEKALAMSDMMDQIAEYGGFDEDGVFRIFIGKEEECKHITSEFHDLMKIYSAALTVVATIFGGPLGGMLAAAATGAGMSVLDEQYCCQADPGDINIGATYGYCDQGDVELAAARLGKRAIQVTPGSVKTNESFCFSYAAMMPNNPAAGEFAHAKQICNHWAKPWSVANTQIQVDKYQRWCKFDSMLGRIVQEQGREQLKRLAATNVGGATSRSTEFSFYGKGGWTTPMQVNGNTVRFWQWDEACSDPETSAKAAMTSPMQCPATPDVYVAVCEQGDCSAPPRDPLYYYEPDWEIHELRAENHGLQALTRYVVLEGGCYDDGGCNYDVHAWPAGKGGQLRVSLDMDWPLTSYESGWEHRLWSHNNVHFRPYIYPRDAEDAKPRLQMCVGKPESCSWQEISVPDPITDLEHVVNSSPRVTLLGQCEESGMCRYRATVHIKLTAKPWYTYSQKKYSKCMLKVPLAGCVSRESTTYDRQYKPHCDGFTLDEFMALDFNQMDLSEYIETLSSEAKKEFDDLWRE